MMRIRSILLPIATVTIILSVSAALIAYGRGYRINLNKPTQLKPTGLISATSDPVGAQVLVDTKLITATNNSFAIEPAWYVVRLVKEGYIPWEKKLRVQGEVVTRADAYLFPTSPSLSPLTTSGILSPTVSPDGTMVAFLIPANTGTKKPGLYTLELADRPLGGRNRDPKLVAEMASQGLSLRTCKESPCDKILWSPDGAEIVVLAQFGVTLYDLANPSFLPRNLSEEGLISLQNDWRKETNQKNQQKLAAFKQPFVDVATTSARIVNFSPDETKLLYEATASASIPLAINPPLIGTNPTEEARTIKPGNLYVYDSREDKNYFIGNLKLEFGNSTQSVLWLPTNKHLILVLPGKIDVMEYDRTNWTTLYSGPFNEAFLTPWPTGSRIVILTNLNPGAGNLPNLYTVNLR